MMEPATGVKRCLAAVAVTLAIFAGIAAYLATTYQITGKATYREGVSPHSTTQVVTRESSPSEFREVTNYMWVKSGVFFALAIGSFVGYRKLDENF